MNAVSFNELARNRRSTFPDLFVAGKKVEDNIINETIPMPAGRLIMANKSLGILQYSAAMDYKNWLAGKVNYVKNWQVKILKRSLTLNCNRIH